MIQYPIEFHATTTAESGIDKHWITECSDGKSPICVPKVFEGSGGALSPEDLFSHALTNCFIATFQVYAHKSKLTFESLTTRSRLVVDLDENKKPVMKEFYCNVNIHKASQPERALVLATKAANSGFVLNSVKTKTHFVFEIT
jgi:organic hydroperoxide reductase OsmC/OhrA